MIFSANICQRNQSISQSNEIQVLVIINLKALSVNDSWAGLVIFLLGNPHLLKGGEGSQDRSSDPHGILALRWGNDLDLHGGRSQSDHLFGQSLSDTFVHGATSRENDVGIQVLSY
jgi:hypothetical protein